MTLGKGSRFWRIRGKRGRENVDAKYRRKKKPLPSKWGNSKYYTGPTGYITQLCNGKAVGRKKKNTRPSSSAAPQKRGRAIQAPPLDTVLLLLPQKGSLFPERTDSRVVSCVISHNLADRSCIDTVSDCLYVLSACGCNTASSGPQFCLDVQH